MCVCVCTGICDQISNFLGSGYQATASTLLSLGRGASWVGGYLGAQWRVRAAGGNRALSSFSAGALCCVPVMTLEGFVQEKAGTEIESVKALVTRRINKAGLLSVPPSPLRPECPRAPSRPFPAPSAGRAGEGAAVSSELPPSYLRSPSGSASGALSPPPRTPQPTHLLPPLLTHTGTGLPKISTLRPPPSRTSFQRFLSWMILGFVRQEKKEGARAGEGDRMLAVRSPEAA